MDLKLKWKASLETYLKKLSAHIKFQKKNKIHER